MLTRFLKKTATSIAPSVTSLSNQSLKDGRVPLESKLSHVVPIPKQTPVIILQEITDQYLLSKILESHVYNVIADYLDETHPLSDRQWGSRAGRSTVGSTTSQFWKLERKSVPFSMTIRIKAFDSVPHHPSTAKQA